jgi:anaerobic selenocysteine-containing dehydrogenase
MAKAKASEGLSWGHSTVETACPLDCPDACSLAVTVEKGRVVQIDASDKHPVTRGYICAKVRNFGERLYGAARLRYPAVRQGPKGAGSFRRVSWEEALDIVVQKITRTTEEWGAESILPFSYGGSNGLVSQDTTDAELFRALGTSRLARTVCAAPTGAAALGLYGKMPGVGYADYRHARLIVVWGANPSKSGIHLVPFLNDALANGAQLAVIDPRRTPLAKKADLYLPVKPGTDLPVALALHRYLFEHGLADEPFLREHTTGWERLRERADEWTIERAASVAGVDPDLLLTFAGLYADTSPAVIRCGWGLERNRNGGSAACAILALPAVAGKFGVRGGGYTMSSSAAWGVPAASWIRVPEPATRLVNMNHLGRVLTEPDGTPVKLLFVYNCNPVATMPDQNRVVRGLMREDLFTIVFEQVATDTTAYADLVLPATTFLESYDLVRGYGSGSLQLARPAIDTYGESRPNAEVFSELKARLGVGPDGETETETLLRVLSNFPEEGREAVLDGQAAFPPAVGETPIQFGNVFPRTPDRRADLCPSDLDASAPLGLYGYQADPGSEDFPLALISPSSEKTISSTLGELRRSVASLQMHPEDASARGLADGDAVRVYNALGEVEVRLTISTDVRPGTACLPKGLWRRSTLNGSTANALAPDTLTDLGGGACFNDARVQVAKIVVASLGGRNISMWTH